MGQFVERGVLAVSHSLILYIPTCLLIFPEFLSEHIQINKTLIEVLKWGLTD
jgi:hypothetical protein